jgi:hypothetical protein
MLTTEIKTKLYTLVGISDEHTDCDCCGRSGLKRTMVLRPTDGTSADGSFDFVYFGTGCGAKALMWAEGEKPAKKMGADALARKAQEAQRMADMKRKSAEYQAQMEAHRLWPLVVETEARITTPEGMTFREHMNALRANPDAYAFYRSQRDYANGLRERIKAEIGPLKF